MTLDEFFAEHPKCALGFSGGVDSSYLLYAAKKAGADIKAYYARTAFQPEFEYQDAMRMAKELKADTRALRLNVLRDERVTANPENRCYYCKINIFSAIAEAAASDGYTVLLDGTNASDDAGDRPGMKALRELSVLSPLRLCGLTKDEIRRRSREAGLFTWDKPAYACLATRVQSGQTITEEILCKVENSETLLFKLGFRDFRVRVVGDTAKLQIKEEQMGEAMAKRREILNGFKPYFASVVLDMEAR